MTFDQEGQNIELNNLVTTTSDVSFEIYLKNGSNDNCATIFEFGESPGVHDFYLDMLSGSSLRFRYNIVIIYKIVLIIILTFLKG